MHGFGHGRLHGQLFKAIFHKGYLIVVGDLSQLLLGHLHFSKLIRALTMILKPVEFRTRPLSRQQRIFGGGGGSRA